MTEMLQLCLAVGVLFCLAVTSLAAAAGLFTWAWVVLEILKSARRGPEDSW